MCISEYLSNQWHCRSLKQYIGIALILFWVQFYIRILWYLEQLNTRLFKPTSLRCFCSCLILSQWLLGLALNLYNNFSIYLKWLFSYIFYRCWFLLTVSGFYWLCQHPISLGHETIVAAAARNMELILIAKCIISQRDNPDYNKWAIEQHWVIVNIWETLTLLE